MHEAALGRDVLFGGELADGVDDEVDKSGDVFAGVSEEGMGLS